MYHPTPYCWSTDGGLTHVLYDNHMPPSTGFGWSSLCNEVRIPIEGEHFELNEDVTDDDITCRRCRDQLSQQNVNIEESSIGSINGCLARFERNEEDILVHVERIFHGELHHSLPFKPDSFTGDLAEQVEDVCDECWERYVEHQWASDDMGGELQVEVWEEGGRSKYYAVQAETVGDGREAALRLVSENGLQKDVRRKEIKSITLTPAQDIVY